VQAQWLVPIEGWGSARDIACARTRSLARRRGARQLGRGNREQQRFVVNGSGSRPWPSCRRGTLLFRLVLDVLDEFSEEWLAIRVARKLKAIDMIDVLPDLFILQAVSAHMQLVNALGDGALHIGARFVVRTSSILN
jgi:hypothetical protein